MKDKTSPIQLQRKLIELTGTEFVDYIKLSPNEFVDNSDQIGIFAQDEQEPHKFLTFELHEKRINNQ